MTVLLPGEFRDDLSETMAGYAKADMLGLVFMATVNLQGTSCLAVDDNIAGTISSYKTKRCIKTRKITSSTFL